LKSEIAEQQEMVIARELLGKHVPATCKIGASQQGQEAWNTKAEETSALVAVTMQRQVN
jgi:hypothetical protein